MATMSRSKKFIIMQSLNGWDTESKILAVQAIFHNMYIAHIDIEMMLKKFLISFFK